MTVRVDPTIQTVSPLATGAAAPPPKAEPRRIPWLFALVVVAPTLLATIYFLILAAPIYVSEARFVVRAPTQTQPTGLTPLLQGAGFLPGGESDAFVVHEYALSRDAMADLDRRLRLRQVFGRSRLDLLQRFPRPFESPSNEHLFRAYGRFVSVSHDATTGISTLRVRAFAPADARAMALGLLDGGERVVNGLNDRAEHDAVAEAEREVAEAETRVSAAQRALTGFRSRERIVDPEASSAAGLEMIGRLSGELATLRAERAGLAAAAPQSPQLPGLDDRIRGYEAQVAAERARLAGSAGSIASTMGQYERLTLEREFAARSLTSATTALETARVEARRKRLYLQRIVAPNLPDDAAYPHRLTSILMVLISSLMAYAAIVLVMAGLREHRQ
jgi:BexC/CtrB/KpsE family polysaccharide export inner-membrane protein